MQPNTWEPKKDIQQIEKQQLSLPKGKDELPKGKDELPKIPPGWKKISNPDPANVWGWQKLYNIKPILVELGHDPKIPIDNDGIVGIKIGYDDFQYYIPNETIDILNVEDILQIKQKGGSPNRSIQNLLSQLPANSPLKNIQIPDLSQKTH